MEETLPHWALIFLGVVAVGAAFIKAGNWLLNGAKEITDLREAKPTLLKIADEFRPNGGGSLRDVIDKIDSDLAAAKTRFEDRTVEQDKINSDIKAGQRAIEAKLDDLIAKLGGE